MAAKWVEHGFLGPPQLGKPTFGPCSGHSCIWGFWGARGFLIQEAVVRLKGALKPLLLPIATSPLGRGDLHMIACHLMWLDSSDETSSEPSSRE
eukprot:37265-Amphidinium_carterae.1